MKFIIKLDKLFIIEVEVEIEMSTISKTLLCTVHMLLENAKKILHPII
jgi:hypothetical protein